MKLDGKKITSVCVVSDEMLHPTVPQLSWWKRVVLRRHQMTQAEYDDLLRRLDELLVEANGKIADAIARAWGAAVFAALSPTEEDQR